MRKSGYKYRPPHSSVQWFHRILIIYMIVLALVMVGLLATLWRSLARYQASLTPDAEDPEVALAQSSQAFIVDYVSGLSSYDWAAIAKEHAGAAQDTDDTLAQYYDEVLNSGSLSYYRTSDYVASAPSYLVRIGSEDVAVFNLVQVDDSWGISSVELMLSGTEKATFSAPVDVEVYCNGALLDDSNIIANGAKEAVGIPSDYADQLTGVVEYATYSLQGLLDNPSISFTATDSNYGVATDAAGDCYLILSGTSGSDYQSRALEFTKALLNYYTQGKTNTEANENACLSLVASGSKAASAISQSYTGLEWRTDYSSGNTYSTEVSEVYVIADNCYAVDVSYTRSGDAGGAISDKGSYRIYFIDLGSGFKIYSFSV